MSLPAYPNGTAYPDVPPPVGSVESSTPTEPDAVTLPPAEAAEEAPTDAVPADVPAGAPAAETPVPFDLDDEFFAEEPIENPTLSDPPAPAEPPAPPTASSGIRWTRPGSPDDIPVPSGPYKGRAQVGDAGAMLRVQPSVRSRLLGAHVADSTVDAGVASASVSVGAVSIKGASHHYSAAPRQDAYAIGSDDDWVVIGIADGVSEGKLSHAAAVEAARVVVAESLRALSAGIPETVDWSDVGGKVREAVRALGLRRAHRQLPDGEAAPDISDRTIAKLMATTCDVLITPTERRDGSLRVWRIRIAGDGSFYVLDPELGWALLNAGKDAGASTVDNAVSDPLPIGGSTPDVTTWELAPGQAAILCTDGFGDVIGEGGLPVGRYLFEAWQEPLDTVQLLFTSSFVNINADDDRTAAIVWATA